MPFSSNTYHYNKMRRRAREIIAEAKLLRMRIRTGIAYDWERDIMLPSLIRQARSALRLARHYRLMGSLNT